MSDRINNDFSLGLRTFFSKICDRSGRGKAHLPSRLKKRRGIVVLSYLLDPFRKNANPDAARGHTNWQECLAMSEVWQDAGFDVWAVSANNHRFVPSPQARVLIDIHSNLEHWQTHSASIKILHVTGAHWLTQNRAELSRLEALRDRRGVCLLPRRQVPPSLGIESAHAATYVGNEFTAGTFRYADKPLHRIPISSVYTFSWPDRQNLEEAKRSFLWLGSYGMVHRGLDLILEAFAKCPHLSLSVCGRPEKEEDFFNLYRRELTMLPNIHFVGWTEMSSPAFEEIRQTHGSVISASASEGGGGAVIHCMHAGLLPVTTHETSVDHGDFGVSIRNGTVEAVGEAIEFVAGLSSIEFEARARSAYDCVRSRHTLDQFTAHYRAFVDQIIHD